MDDERARDLADAFSRASRGASGLGWCGQAAASLVVDGAGITLMAGSSAGCICATDEWVGRLEDLQYTLGEGPCQDAHRTGRSVHEPRLVEAERRWPAFAGPAIDEGALAVFALPLRAGSVGVGVLTLYHGTPGDLSDDQVADGAVVADLLTRSILAPFGDRPYPLPEEVTAAVAHRAEVHQAIGMVAVQLSEGTAEALVRIRAHAFVAGRSVADVARDVVARRLRFDDDTPGEPPV
jgi:hypothetical protein